MEQARGRSRTRLPAVFRQMLGRLVPGLLVAGAVLAGVVYYVDTRPDEYTSVAIVTFSPRVDRPTGADTLQVLAAKYVAFLSSPATQRRVSDEIGVDARTIRDSLQAEIPPATASLSVSVTMTDPETATRLANALASVAARESIDDVNLRAEILAPAVVPLAPSGPPRTLIAAAGAGFAVAAGVFVVMALERIRVGLSSLSTSATAASPG